jgi:hypothetical protein
MQFAYGLFEIYVQAYWMYTLDVSSQITLR